MNRDLLVEAIANVDDEFIIEAREKYEKRVKIVKFKIPVRLTKKFFISVAACACAIILCVCLPIALSPSNNPVVPPQIDTGTPPTDVTPPSNNVETPSVTNKPYIEEGYVSSGNSGPITGYMLAYKINRQFDETTYNISIQLSFGKLGLKYFDGEYEFTKVVVYVKNNDRQAHILEELTAEQFLDSDNKYNVEIEYTYGDLGDGYDVVTSETIIYNNEQTIAFPSSLCNKNSGFLNFVLAVYNGDEIVPNTGYATTVYYLKLNGTINFKTYREYLLDKYA